LTGQVQGVGGAGGGRKMPGKDEKYSFGKGGKKNVWVERTNRDGKLDLQEKRFMISLISYKYL